MIVFSLARLALAGDSATIRISCTIPEITGVNIGIVKENPTLGSAVLSSIMSKPQESTINTPIAFQKDTKEIRMVDGHTTQLAVRTIYSR